MLTTVRTIAVLHMTGGRITGKAINHLGDEVVKVFRV
jgi:hypothetical protein